VLINGVGGNTAANGLFVVGKRHAHQLPRSGGPVGNGSFNNNTWSIAVTGASTTAAVINTSATTGPREWRHRDHLQLPMATRLLTAHLTFPTSQETALRSPVPSVTRRTQAVASGLCPTR